MTGRHAEPVEAVATDGIVALFVDPDTARAIADAWEFTYATGGLDDTQRPAYLLDTRAIRQAAIDADRQSGVDPAPTAHVPFLSLAGKASS